MLNRGVKNKACHLHCIAFGSVLIFISPVSVLSAGLVSTSLNGSLGYSYRGASDSNKVTNDQQLLKATIDNSFFIWQDWFIVGQSNLTLTREENVNNGIDTESLSATGGIAFNVLPQSKAPFNFSYARSDSRVSSDLYAIKGTDEVSLDDNVINDSVSIAQGLIGKSYTIQARYTKDDNSSTLRGKYGSELFIVNGLHRSFAGVLRASVRQRDDVTYNGLERSNLSTNLDHGYTGFKQVTINTVVNSNQVNQVSGSQVGAESLRYEMDLIQATTNVVWRSLNKKTTVTGSLRFFDAKMKSNRESSNDSTTYSASLNFIHRYSSNLNFSASSVRSLNVNKDGNESIGRDQLGVNYTSTSIEFGEYAYNWRTGATLSRREEKDDTKYDGSTNAGHVLSRSWLIGRNQRLNVRGDQDLSLSTVTNADSDELRKRLGHRVSVNWMQSAPNSSRKLSVSLSDQRELGVGSSMQAMNVNFNQNNTLSQRMKLNGSLNYQLTNLNYSDTAASGTSSNTATASMNIDFTYMNPFSISGMRFISNYGYTQPVDSRELELGSHQRWDNRLAYRVGKIDVSLQYMYREARKISYNMVYFNVKRVF